MFAHTQKQFSSHIDISIFLDNDQECFQSISLYYTKEIEVV